MHILFESSITDEIKSKYILLPLDTFHFKTTNVTEVAYCLIENNPIMEMMYVDQWRSLHNNMVENFHKKNWKYCEDAIEHLKGRWGGELDSFYDDVLARIGRLKNESLPEDWTGHILKH